MWWVGTERRTLYRWVKRIVIPATIPKTVRPKETMPMIALAGSMTI